MGLTRVSDVTSVESIERQVDELLEEILDDDILPEPATAIPSTRDEEQRVVVTGMGVVTPLGIGLDTFWEGLAAG
ncbi:MAG TPA: beta-ketoacyl synthase N-terminal-like domain-containing protein, partial [Nitrososphaera sp.]|nr:beta-ketoacyl synthase N-terminal-like domain-containing protein [Nitrososphaera sp.]